MHRTILSALIALAVAGCTLTGGEKAATATSLEAEEISVTSLDAAEEAPEAEPAAPEVEAVAAPAAEAAAEPAVEAVAEPLPEVVAPLSPAAISCGKKGGRFISVAKGAGNACVKVTGDAGKRCSRETDCEGRCLARSGTCSPLDPLFGCNEILQANGARVTLCLD